MKISIFFVLALGCVSLSCNHASSRIASDHQDQKQGNAKSSSRAHQTAQTTDPNRGADRTALQATAEAVWKARANRDCQTIAKYLDPNEFAALTQDERVEECEKDPFRYEKYRITNVEVEGRYGWSHVEYSAKFAPYSAEPAQEIQTVEKWRLINDQWYPVPSRLEETCPESPSVRDAAEEARLKERFEKTWTLRLARDWKALYEMTDPKDHGNVSESTYADSEAMIEYFAHELDWVEVRGDVGEIRVTYDNKLNDPSMSKMRGRKINMSEHWIKRNGEWYRDLLRQK